MSNIREPGDAELGYDYDDALIAEKQGRRKEDRRCNTCQWWVHETDHGYLTNDDPNDWGTCGLTELWNGADPVHRRSLALAVDAESYAAILWTREDFSCIQWVLSQQPT